MNPPPVDLIAHDEWLRPMVRSLVAEDQVDDVLQDTWLAAMHKPPRAGSIRAWLARVAVNLARMRRRRERRRQHREAIASRSEAQPSTVETVEKLHLQAALAKSVAELDEPYREAIILRFHDGCSSAEVARLQGITAENARQRVKRGLDRLRHAMAGERGRDWQRGAAVLTLLRAEPVSPPLVLTETGFGVWAMSRLLRGLAAVVILSVAFFSVRSWVASAELESVPVGEVAGASEIESSVIPGEEEVHASSSVRQRLAETLPLSASELAPFRGLVVDVRGRPLTGVEFEGRVRIDAAVEEPVKPVLARSDSAGLFSIESSEPVQELRVLPPYVMLRAPAKSALLDREDEMLAVVAAAGGIAGRVTDEAGLPLAGVRVRAVVKRLAELPMPLDPTVPVTFEAMLTAADGLFDMQGLPAEQSRLVFTRPGYERVSMSVEPGLHRGENVVLAILEEGRFILRGTVSDHRGRLLPGARVGLGRIQVQADERGAYRLELDESILDTDRSLYASMPAMQTWVHESPRALFSENVDLEFDIRLAGEAKTIAGRVIDGEGEPMPGLHLRLWMEHEIYGNETGADLALDGIAEPQKMEVANPRVYAITDAQGFFELRGLQDKEYQIRVRQPETWLSWTVGPVQAGRRDLEILAPTKEILPRVNGRVVGRDGQPVADVQVEYSVQKHHSPRTNSWSGPQEKPRSDRDGRFVLEQVPVADKILVVVSGKEIIVHMQQFEKAELLGDLLLTVDRLCRFRVELSNANVQEIGLLDGQGERVEIWERKGKTNSGHRNFPLTDGRTPILLCSEIVHWVLLLDAAGKEIERLPIRVRPGEVSYVGN